MELDDQRKDALEKSGRVWLRNAISDADLSLLDEAASVQARPGQRLKPSDALGHVLSTGSSLLTAIRTLDPCAKPVRVVAFNKSDDANWGIPWHQDRVIAVDRREDVDGYRNWTNKSDIWHCEPPQAILDDMLFVRVHLDDTDLRNGAMEIAVGSHADGIVPATQAEDIAGRYPREVCEAKRGDVLVLKMLTLHSSRPAQVQSGRRVLRVDFSPSDLPRPLSWAQIADDSAPVR